MDTQRIIDLEANNVLQTYSRPDILFTHGEGAYLFDAAGKQYLDMTSGIAVTALGHGDEEWVSAVIDQARKLVHVSNLYHTSPQAELAAKLCANSFADKVYFCNSGAESNEAAIKFARKFAVKNGHDNKSKIVSFTGAFHGRTMGALAVTPREKYQKPFKPLMPNTALGIFNDAESARAVIDDEVCAVFVEPIQGEGGIIPADASFLEEVRDLCDKHGALLIFDEVQCGLGRTGTLWGHEALGIEPDIMSLAKPLAGGLPIGATLVSQRVADAIDPGDHASTFAAGPLVCRAAQVVFDRVSEPTFLKQVEENGRYLRAQLEARLPADKVVEFRGIGLMQGVEFTDPVKPITSGALDKGLLIIGAGEKVLRLVPPLIITKAQIDDAIDIILECMAHG